MAIAIELVPRSPKTLENDLKTIQKEFSSVSAINIPDLKRFKLRSWEASILAKKYFTDVIPHICASFTNKAKALELIEFFKKNKITKTLVISGDHRDKKNWGSIELIRFFSQNAPGLKVYAGLDPYRQALKAEYEYCQAKLKAGAVGFFTQPFFDFRLLACYYELFRGADIYWGVSPVTSIASKKYWEAKNNVVFPRDFEPTLEWNRAFLAKVLAEIVEKQKSNVYIMPIKLDILEYLKGIL